MNRFFYLTSVVVVALAFVYPTQASEETIGPKGINSVATGLTGMGALIGQVEPNRPGKHGYDTAANCCNVDVVPAGVLVHDRPANVNEEISDHAIWVASVMISKQMTAPPGTSAPLGVAQQANLYSSAYIVGDEFNLQEDAAISAQALASIVWDTNMSFGVPNDGSFVLDGNSTLTQFVDWSTVRHQVLYIIAGAEVTKPPSVPSDSYNGITVAASARGDDDVFRKVAVLNEFDEAVDAVGERTSTHILAPGDRIDVAGPNGTVPSQFASAGTSVAAPHVTGTLALLQQQANTANANNHLTKKAVILNSADKIKGVIDMERTVVNRDGHRWSNTPTMPLHRQMGVGHLNAKRAVEQHAAGERAPGGVGDIGWDLFFQDDPFIPNKYTLSLDAGDYVSATLVWDREVFLDSPFLDYSRGDQFIDSGFANLDLYLVPAGQGIEQAVASSISTAWNLEHIFEKVQDAGNYELQVWTSELNPIPYALAWWAGADDRGAPGDFNSDGSVNAADYVVWRKTDGTQQGFNEWRANFGTTSGSGSLASVPEPGGVLLLLFGIVMILRSRI
jgi:hypothetical protein